MHKEQLVNKESTIGLTLTLAMLVTSGFHFGTALHLPDATLAVFFLTGYYLRNRLLLPLMLILAGVSDYLAIKNGTSDWCVSPAYVFLIPTYASLWFGGRWFAARDQVNWRGLTALLVALSLSGSVAFIISNGSFYLLSGRFPDINWLEYSSRVVKYYPPYMGSLFLYVAAAALIQLTASQYRQLNAGRKQTDLPEKR